MTQHTRGWSACSWLLGCLAILLGLSLPVLAAPRTWDGGAADLDWSNPVNWDGNASVPGNGDDVTITSSGGPILLSGNSANLNSLVIGGNTLTFTNWSTTLTATDITIQNGGSLTHSRCLTNGLPANTNRVNIECSSLTVQSGGLIDVNYAGFKGGLTSEGEGPGGGKVSGTSIGGGSFGGKGGNGSTYGNEARATYGSAAAPEQPGSGGGNANNGGTPSTADGGGVIRISASGAVTIDGIVRANGKNSPNTAWYGGGGSGGSISIVCNTLRGSGSVQASGGQAAYGGGGGGGRIAIVYDPTAQNALTAGQKPSILYASSGGIGTYGGGNGQPGTLYLTDTQGLSERVSGFEWALTQQSWTVNNLVVTNINTTDYSAVCVFQDVNLTVLTNVTLNRSALDFRGNAANVWTSSIGGKLTMTNGAALYVNSANSNSPTSYGGLLRITGELTVNTNCWVYPSAHPTNGGSVKFEVGSLLIPTANAGFDANGLGFRGGTNSSDDGFGPGKGKDGSVGGGGGYGGLGGGASGVYGKTYGSSNAPAYPGSGGGGNSQDPRGDGGGLVWVAATGDMLINGKVTANGLTNSGNWYEGGGSGGGINLTCMKLSGTGSLSAKGGDGNSFGHGGGGGRIAVHMTADNTGGLMSTNVAAGAKGGSAGAGNLAEAGTIVWVIIPPPKGMVILLR